MTFGLIVAILYFAPLLICLVYGWATKNEIVYSLGDIPVVNIIVSVIAILTLLKVIVVFIISIPQLIRNRK